MQKPQMDPLDVAIGARVRMRRRQLGWSQDRLGETLGVSFQQVQKYERGSNRISGSTLIRIAQALEVPTSLLLGEGEAPEAMQVWTSGVESEDLVVLEALRRVRSRKVRTAVLRLLERLAEESESVK